MSTIINKLVDHFHYTIESIKNRYPCKIIKTKNITNWNESSSITYRAVTKYNIRECDIENILNDPMLVEKFHPTDCIKLGFIAAGDILLKQNLTPEQAKELYANISAKMIGDINSEYQNDSQ